jgi:hypothetical protein
MGQVDECCLWNIRMGQIGFYILIKISKKEAVKDTQKIIKPSNNVFKHCQHGKKTKVRFKKK